MEILFVCTGNASRSVMGEIMFRQYLAERGHDDIFCSSAGTDAIEGLDACPQTMEVCEEIGVDLSGHVRRMLTKELVEQGVRKLVPIVGSIISGGITFVSMRSMGMKLISALDKGCFDYTAEDYKKDIREVLRLTEPEEIESVIPEVIPKE